MQARIAWMRAPSPALLGLLCANKTRDRERGRSHPGMPSIFRLLFLAFLSGTSCRALLASPFPRLATDLVFALHQAAAVGAGGNVPQINVARYWSKQRNALADQHRNARDNHPIYESGCEEALDGDAAVNIRMFEAALRKLRHDFRRFARHLLHDSVFHPGKILPMAAQDHDRLLAISPFLLKAEHDLESLSPNDNHIDAASVFFKAVRSGSRSIEEIEGVVRARKKAIDAHAAEDRSFQLRRHGAGL